MGKNKSTSHHTQKSISNIADLNVKVTQNFWKIGKYRDNFGASKNFLNMSQKYKGRD